MFYKILKRILDIIFSLFLIIGLFPILVIIIVLLYFFNQKNIFFIQKRIGRNGCIFNIYKFKTMNDKKNKNGILLDDNQRLTKIGSFLRSSSFDELPQLLNVIKGDISLVGPRPLLPEYLKLYNDFQKRRHEVTPGITGWAQINGRNNTTWDERFKNDVWYVDNASFSLDCKIFFLTLFKIILRQGIDSQTNTTNVAGMEKFKGNK